MAGMLPLPIMDRLYTAGGSLTTHGCTIQNLVELEQSWQPGIRNTDVSGLPVGRPEEPSTEGLPVTFSLLVIGEVDLTLPTPGTHSDPRVGVKLNWRSLVANVFTPQLSAETIELFWDRRTMAGWETVSAEVQFSSWQINGEPSDTDLACSVEVTRFTEWAESGS